MAVSARLDRTPPPLEVTVYFRLLYQRFLNSSVLKNLVFLLPNVCEKFNFSVINVCENCEKYFEVPAETARKSTLFSKYSLSFRNVREKQIILR